MLASLRKIGDWPAELDLPGIHCVPHYIELKHLCPPWNIMFRISLLWQWLLMSLFAENWSCFSSPGTPFGVVPAS